MIGMGTTIFLVNPQTFGGSSFTNEKSLLFDGVDEYVTMSDSASLSVTSNLSLTAWIKTTDTGSGSIIEKWASSGNRSYEMSYSSGYLYIGVCSNGVGNRKRVLSTQTDLSDGNWHFVCATFDNSGSVPKLYVDGSEETSTSVLENDTMTTIYDSTTNLTIGGVGTFLYFDGYIDECAIWDTTVLSASDISDLYNSGAPTDLSTYSGSANLVSWWRMGDGDTFPTITDNVGSNDGTMTNMESGDIVTDTP